MEFDTQKNIVEVLLMTSDTPLTINQIRQTFNKAERPSTHVIKSLLQSLSDEYQNRGFEIHEHHEAFFIRTKKAYQLYVASSTKDKVVSFSKAIIEVLAIIAYQQPITRSDIESIRGISVSSSIIKSLLEKNLININGYKEGPGKPALYVTTPYFLQYFDLSSLNDLPNIPLNK